MSLCSRRCGHGLGVVSMDRLGHQSHANSLGTDLDADNAAIDQRTNFVNVRFEFAMGDAGDFRTDAAKVFGLAAMGDLVSEGGFLAGKMTDAWHWLPR